MHSIKAAGFSCRFSPTGSFSRLSAGQVGVCPDDAWFLHHSDKFYNGTQHGTRINFERQCSHADNFFQCLYTNRLALYFKDTDARLSPSSVHTSYVKRYVPLQKSYRRITHYTAKGAAGRIPADPFCESFYSSNFIENSAFQFSLSERSRKRQRIAHAF